MRGFAMARAAECARCGQETATRLWPCCRQTVLQVRGGLWGRERARWAACARSWAGQPTVGRAVAHHQVCLAAIKVPNHLTSGGL